MTTGGIDKQDLLALLRSRLAGNLERLTSSQKTVQAGATHPDNKQEHAKDMRSTEASYLARGLAERVETLRDAVRTVELLRARPFGSGEAAGPGALVTVVDEDDNERIYFLAPAGGGETLAIGGREVLVLTPRSPLGAAITGRRTGESFSVELPAGLLRADIERVE
jgi:transcription elongation GreA/GreB family factor